MNTALAIRSGADYELVRQQASDLIKTGFLPTSIKTAEQAIAIKMMADALDIHWIVGLQSINVIQGKPTVSPQLMVALARRSRQLEYLKVVDDGSACTVQMKRLNEPEHVETFSMDDARKMGLDGKDNWRKQPAVMRKWRAIAAACRVVFPDVTWGIASYTPEEMGANVAYNDDGSIADIEVPTIDIPALPPNGNGHAAEKPPEPSQPGAWHDDPAKVEAFYRYFADKHALTQSDVSKLLGKPLNQFATGREAELAVKAAFNKPAATANGKLNWADDPAQMDALAKHLLDGFELAPDAVLKRLNKSSWKDYLNLDAAKADILDAAAEQNWDMIATTANYYEYGSPNDENKRRIIRFNTPRLTVWYKGRKELVKALDGTATTPWIEVEKWEPQTDLAHAVALPLPERVRITPQAGKNGGIEVARIVAAESIPF